MFGSLDQLPDSLVGRPICATRFVSLSSRCLRWLFRLLSMLAVTITVGCGTTRERGATDQLLLSDAVDRCVARIDFSPLSGDKVFLDSQYVRTVKSSSIVNADYIISALRQRLLMEGCLIQDTRDEADIIVEPRVGTLGHDAHDVNYGVPMNNALQSAAELVGKAPPLPAVPEISLGKKSEEAAAAKIAVFAYYRETKEPVWQSGLKVARSTSKSKWILGAGPFQSGQIYKGTTYFAGERLPRRPFQKTHSTDEEAEQAFMSASVFDTDLLKRKLRGDTMETAAETQLAESTPETISKKDAKPLPEAAPVDSRQATHDQPGDAPKTNSTDSESSADK